MVNKSLFRSYTLETQTVTVQTFFWEGGWRVFLIFIEQFKHKLFSVWYKPQHVKLLRRKQTRWLHRWKTWTILAFGVCLSAPFSQSVQTLGEIIEIRRWFFIFFLSSSNVRTRIIFRVVLPKPQCVKLLRQKQTPWRQNCRFCIWLDSVHFSEFAFQLLSFTSDIIYLQIVLLETAKIQKFRLNFSRCTNRDVAPLTPV